MTKTQITVAIIGAAVAGALTEAAGFFPNIKEILVAGNVLVSVIVAFVLKPKE